MTLGKPRHPTTYGWRAKIGVIVPPTNTVNEAEWNQMVPDGVTVHVTRMPLHDDTTSDAGKKTLYADIELATSYLAKASLDTIAYGCTAGSMVQPPSSLSDFMADVAGIPCVTTAGSLVAALKHVAATKIAIATPYHDALNQHELAFFTEVGFDVLGIEGLGIGESGPTDYVRIAKTPPETIFDHIVASDHQEADAMMVSCTDFPVLNMIPHLEEKLGKPVVTSNQATFWAALRAAQITDSFDNFGRLLKST